MSPLLLLVYAAALAVVAGPRLARAGWVLRAPQLALGAWLVLSFAVLAAGLLTALTLLLYWDRAHDLVQGAWHVCLDALLGRNDAFAQATACVGLLMLTLLLVRIGVGAARLFASQRTSRAELRAVVRLAKVPSPVSGVTVVDHHRPAAYLMPGRDRDIVMTLAAVQRLQADEVAAVLAHERAHVTGRHYQLMHWTRLLVQAFPRIGFFGLVMRQVERLVEMSADDIAVRATTRIRLAHALVAMAEPAPDGTLAVNGGDSIERLRRLLDPPTPLRRITRAAVAAVLLLVAVTPVFIAVVVRAVPWGFGVHP